VISNPHQGRLARGLLDFRMEGAMGTVGLSFGSPTSGTGFDVSATVSQIVGNLKNVETPWKTQLTSLQSQDTAISSLGTLFSKLSNDLSSLTDFMGVLAQKTGASSNTNVVQLTAASTAATAGTHTVVVNNLAQTSSGYLDEITNLADNLSGTLSIAVNGNSQEFDLSKLSNPTLAGLASAINSSGIGVTAGVLTDANGSRLSLVSGTSGANGQMTITSVLTDTSLVTGTNSTGAMNYNPTVDGKNASLVVDGVPLSSTTNIVSNLIPGVTFQMLSASPVDSNGNKVGIQVVIGNDNATVESTINSMVIDYNSLVSAINTQQGNDSSGNPEPLFGSPTLSLLQQQLLGGINKQNPNGYLDSIKNSSDTLSGTLTIAVGSGTAQQIDISTLSDQTLSGVASAINSASMGVTANVLTDASGSRLVLVSGTAGSTGALSVTSAITDTATSKALSYNNGGSDISGLANLGITMNNDGTISLDVASLDGVLNSDFGGVTGFFQNANSWGTTFANVLNNAGTSSPTGILTLAERANSTTESNLNAYVSKEESMISAQQKSLTTELNSANEILQALPTQLDSTNMLYAAISGYNTNKG
jgi:flagellar hook-associated protein 2